MNFEDLVTKDDLADMERRILQAIIGKIESKDRNMTIDEAVEYIRARSRSTIYKLTSSGELAYQKVGKSNIFKKSDLDRYLAKKRRASNTEIQSYAALRSLSFGKESTKTANTRRRGDRSNLKTDPFLSDVTI